MSRIGFIGPWLIAALLLTCVGVGIAQDSSTGETEKRGVHRQVLKAIPTDGDEPISLYRESHALLIGASRYTVWSELPSIPNELDAVADALTDSGFSVERLIDPDSRGLKEGIVDFINNFGYEPENRLLIYFSGHGHTVRDKGFLLPVDIPLPDDRQNFRRKALPMTQVLAWAKDMEAKHVLFVFDSCFSGSVFKSRSMPKDKDRYIRKVTAEPVRQFITAGSANEEVPAKSTFTPAFVAAIRGEGDLNNDGYITGSELGVHLSQLVPQFVEQNPQYGKIREYELSRGDFVFFSQQTREPEPVPEKRLSAVEFPPLAELPADTIEVMVWQSSEKGDSLTEYRGYLKRYPAGLFATIALARIENLEKAVADRIVASKKQQFRLRFEPEMVLIPSGRLVMGSTNGADNERPVHTVEISGFEISKYEITFDEFDEFTQATVRENRDDGGWGRGNRPVVNVPWEMAQEYVQWLSSRTDKKYRLPIEAEWEYAARAGSQEDYSFGSETDSLCDYANMTFKSTVCQEEHKYTAPVGSFLANNWGLHDMHGNVWEWTEDCWHQDYSDAPGIAQAWTQSGECDQRVVRGGAWYSDVAQLRSAARNKNRAVSSNDSTGFRVVRMLN